MDKRFLQESGIGIFTGNELIVKGGLESRVALITGYPGSPVAEVFDAAERVKELLAEKGILAQIANNEALAGARLNGSQMEGIRALAVMKSVGAHVASDALALGNMAGTAPGGAVVAVFGDDIWSEGTQVPADSRFISQHLYMPVVEPSTYQEMKDWIGLALDLSEGSRLFVAYVVTSNQADGGGTVLVSPNRFPDLTTNNPSTLRTASIPLDDRVIIPPHTAAKEVEVLEHRLPRFLDLARQLGMNRLLYTGEGRKPIGFITSGISFCYLEHVLQMVGLTGAFPVLKLGVTYPVDDRAVKALAERVDEIYVVEEKRAFVEQQVAAILRDLVQAGELSSVRLWGKRFPDGLKGLPEAKGLNPSLLLAHLAPVFKGLTDPTIPVDRDRIDREVALIQETATYPLQVAVRTPSFCPGCPHRDSASVMKDIALDFEDGAYMKAHHGQGAEDLVFHGDIGCYSLLKYDPYDRLMHNLSGMGLGGGTGAGIDPFITNKQVVFMGDSTFFHSGMVAISDSIKNGQDITYVILDNKTTAMTGHQPTPGNDVDIMGRPTFAQDIERVVQGLTKGSGATVVRMDPADRMAYRKMLEDVFMRKGVKVVIADKECGITYHRRVKQEKRQVAKQLGHLPEETHINITPEVCEYCLECTRGTGCSGLTVAQTPYGPKIATDLSLCVADTACAKFKACPSFEEVKVVRRQAPEVRVEALDVGQLPDPERVGLDEAWYAYVAGVGGMGINVVSAILATAGMRQGYEVRFTNKKGLAIRNGSVYSHVLFAEKGVVISPIIPYGKADLLIGLDILEAARGLNPAGNLRVGSPRHTTAVVNTAKTPTTTVLMGRDDFDPAELEAMLRAHTREGAYFGQNLSAISERYLGHKVYANLILLGAAYQKGLLPLDEAHLLWAIQANLKPDEVEPNLRAFQIGRKMVVAPALFEARLERMALASMLSDKVEILRRTRGGGLAERYGQIVERTVAGMALEDEEQAHIALRVYDLIQWDGPEYAEVYARRVRRVYERDAATHGYRATRAVIRYLFKVMAIKDEVYVSHLLTSEEKRRRDFARYNIDPARGDRLEYRHLNRPRFTFLGLNIEFNVTTRDWMLRIMRRMKFLRKLLPKWHIEEKAFRDWYASLVDRFNPGTEEEYQAYAEIFELPEEVRGYRRPEREIRIPRMEEARRQAEAILRRIETPARRPAMGVTAD
ncbi:MAG: indolepyruvate ferredoxin oxidoreductase [Candidatus Latescibacteria bacterium]|nr:indolepyruvate ferredoxin oxidoreductase [Candidatus Latescibacterota bacterium]